MKRIEAFLPEACQGPQPSAHSLLGSQRFFLPNEVFHFVPKIQGASPPLGPRGTAAGETRVSEGDREIKEGGQRGSELKKRE